MDLSNMLCACKVCFFVCSFYYIAVYVKCTDGLQIKDKKGSGSVMLCRHGLALLVSFEGMVTVNQYKVILADHHFSIMNYFCPDGSGLF